MEMQENSISDTESLFGGTTEERPTAMDLDSAPLGDLGVSVMDQDVFERNVAAQVSQA